MKKRPIDIRREGLHTQDPAITLKQLFDSTDGGLWDHKGVTDAWVSYKDSKGQLYGSHKCVHEVCIEGREYKVSQSALPNWGIHILFTDEVYKPKINYVTQMRSLNLFINC